MGVSATGAYVEVCVRRFIGNERFPTYSPELEYLIRTQQIPQKLVAQLYSDWSETVYSGWERIGIFHNTLLNSGRDFLHNQGYVTAAVITGVLAWAGVSADAGVISVADVTLNGEIGFAGSGGSSLSDLKRSSSACGNVHTAGTNTTTATILWTAANTYTSLDKAALFTSSAGGVMANEVTFSATSLNSGDQLQLQWTITLG